MTDRGDSQPPTSARARRPGEHDDAFEAARPGVFARRLLAEATGTFALVFVDCGGAMIAAMTGEISPAARSAATGLLVMTMVYTMGDVSGAHLNPAVTFAFGLRRAFPWRHVPAYWVVQLLGAIAASVALRGLFGNVAHLGATLPGDAGPLRAFALESILTAILVAVILGTATKHRVLGANAAIASGGAVALCSLFSRPISGASMNPARSIAPALLSGATGDLWLYVAGPALGAVAATALMHAVHQRKHPEEKDAAAGEPK